MGRRNCLSRTGPLITMNHGENYWFNGCARYLMECMGETRLDYWFFSGLTGDNLAQVFSYDGFRGDGVTDYLTCGAEGGRFVEKAFARCGYASTFVPQGKLKEDLEACIELLISSIDRGIPVVRYFYGWGVFVGYENDGEILLYLTEEAIRPERVLKEELFTSRHHAFQAGLQADKMADAMGFGWCFVEGKRADADINGLYREVILDMPRLLTTRTKGYSFGAEAFRGWANQIEGGYFDGISPQAYDEWAMHKVYVCNMATNGSCRAFMERAAAQNPDMGFLQEVIERYKMLAALWNGSDGIRRYDVQNLEGIGGGFNVTLQVLQNPSARKTISGHILRCAEVMDEAALLLTQNLI